MTEILSYFSVTTFFLSLLPPLSLCNLLSLLCNGLSFLFMIAMVCLFLMNSQCYADTVSWPFCSLSSSTHDHSRLKLYQEHLRAGVRTQFTVSDLTQKQGCESFYSSLHLLLGSCSGSSSLHQCSMV